MKFRRAAPTIIVLALLATSVPVEVRSARADTITDAEQRADAARAEQDSAYTVVSGAAENRAELEAKLFEALNRYDQTIAALAEANRKLDRVGRSQAAAEADSAAVSNELQDQVVAAYMEAVLSPGPIVVDTSTVEQAMVIDHIFSTGHNNNLADLDSLTVQLNELDRLKAEYLVDKAAVEELETRLAIDTADLRELFDQADSTLAEAFEKATAADAAYRAALSDVDRARAAEHDRIDEEAPPSTTTPTTPTTKPTDTAVEDPQPATTTTTTSPPATGPPPPVAPSVERWRSMVATYFPSNLVDQALVIIQCESNGDPDSVNAYSGASGLFQFIPSTWAVASVRAGVGDASVFDPEANIAAAAWLAGYYQTNGSDPWAPWTCRNRL